MLGMYHVPPKYILFCSFHRIWSLDSRGLMIHELDSADVDNSNRGADSNGGAYSNAGTDSNAGIDSNMESTPDLALLDSLIP